MGCILRVGHRSTGHGAAGRRHRVVLAALGALQVMLVARLMASTTILDTLVARLEML
jgi:hypothetical protein